MKKRKLNKIMFDKNTVRSFKCFFGNRITLKTVFIYNIDFIHWKLQFRFYGLCFLGGNWVSIADRII